MPPYLQRRFAKKHSHKYVVDSQTNDTVCLHCGKVRGSPRAEPGKYNAIRSVYDGFPYDSKFEAQYAMQLDWRLKGGDIKAWDRQFPIEIRNPKTGEFLRKHKVDFRIHENDGSFTLGRDKGLRDKRLADGSG